MRGKSPIATVPRADAVSGYNSEMVRRARTQAVDVGTDVPERVPTLTLVGGGYPVGGCRAVLEINRGGQPMRIERAIERG